MQGASIVQKGCSRAYMGSIQGVSIVQGLWAATCESISILAGAIEYENLSNSMLVLEDLN